jgi:hypothetical protein
MNESIKHFLFLCRASITITAQMICQLAHQLFFENDFDDADDNGNDAWNWQDDFIELPHGVFWKKADDFCTCAGDVSVFENVIFSCLEHGV